MKKHEAREIVMRETREAMLEYDSIHGGITHDMTPEQMEKYFEDRMNYANRTLLNKLYKSVIKTAV